jgi:predicted amidophosphoribosyltransferase
VEWWQANPNCPGCGAKLRKPACRYCGRLYERPREIRPDPALDPKRNIKPTTVVY